MSRIRQALDYMKVNGWHQAGSFVVNGNSPRCMSNALFMVYKEDDSIVHRDLVSDWVNDSNAISAVCCEQFPHLALDGPTSMFSIFTVNDHPDTTFADVERIMEKAALSREEMA